MMNAFLASENFDAILRFHSSPSRKSVANRSSCKRSHSLGADQHLLSKGDWQLADYDFDADWFRDALKEGWIKKCFRGRKSSGKPIKKDERRYKRRNRIESMFDRLKDGRRIATRCYRCPKVFLFALCETVTVDL